MNTNFNRDWQQDLMKNRNVIRIPQTNFIQRNIEIKSFT